MSSAAQATPTAHPAHEAYPNERWATNPHVPTMGELIENAATEIGDAEAYVGNGTRITFAQWWRAAGGLARELAERGVDKGSVVAISLPPSIEFAIAYAAVHRIGGVVTGMNPRLGSREIAHIIELAGPKVIVCTPELAERLPDEAKSTMLLLEDIPSYAEKEPLPRAEVDPADPALIIWTSGTTGLPKGAVFTNDALRAQAHGASDFIKAWDRRLVPLAFVHGGYMSKVWECVASGTTTVITPVPWRANEMLDLLEKERISVATSAPTQWERMVALPDAADRDLSNFRIAISSTAPASPQLIRRMEDVLGVRVAVRFGCTESGPGTGTRPEDDPEVVSTTLGRPLPGAEVSVVDENGDEVPAGTIGAIRLRNAGTMSGYWRNPEETGKALNADGWLRTGDLGYLREDGNLVLSGRTSELYIRAGYNVYPRESELALMEWDRIADVAVVGVPAPGIGEKGAAFIVPADPANPPTLEDLRAYLRGRIADYKVPEEVRIMDELPLTAFMKLDRQRIKEIAREVFGDQ